MEYLGLNKLGLEENEILGVVVVVRDAFGLCKVLEDQIKGFSVNLKQIFKSIV